MIGHVIVKAIGTLWGGWGYRGGGGFCFNYKEKKKKKKNKNSPLAGSPVTPYRQLRKALNL
jgi:hypothetical protein